MSKYIKTHFDLFVKLLFLTAVVVIPLIFYVGVKQHYEFPKTITARFLLIPATVLFFAFILKRMLLT